MSRLEKPYVLLVDDNEAVCTLVTALLRREFQVECVSDGSEAIERLRVARYGAVLLDLKMPHIDGFGVLGFLQENQPDTLGRVLILTAALTRGEVERVKLYGVCGVIAKPFEVESLLNAVRECVGLDDERPIGGILSTGVIFLIADLIKSRLL